MILVVLAAFLFALLLPHRAFSEPPVPNIDPSPVAKPERNIRYFADLYGVDYVLAKAIAECESQFNPKAENPSGADGLYQFIPGTWKYYGQKKWGAEWLTKDVFDYGDNAELALWVLANYGTGDWNASAWCWEPKINAR